MAIDMCLLFSEPYFVHELVSVDTERHESGFVYLE